VSGPAVPFVIAEAGVNHNGDPGIARDMIAVARDAGADAVKFQAFVADDLVAAGTRTAAYQSANTGVVDQSDLLRSLALGMHQFEDLARACGDAGIEFLCTAFDDDLIDPLVAMGMRRIKVASGELTNVPALRRFAASGLPVLLSTGMATLEEVIEAVAVLREAGAKDITLLHCTSIYPAPESAINLRAMLTMRERCGLPVGYSDHSLGDHVSIAAVALGASVIEKHFTLDRRMPGPDHAASLEPAELANFVRKLRATANSMGDGVKRPAEGEADTANLVRKSWHATRALPVGTLLGAGDIKLKRPASGLAPKVELAGRRLVQARAADEPIRAEDIV
jgi:N,N'-diacetyllegionaminate synthase